MEYRSISSIVSAVAAVILLSDNAHAVTFNGYDPNNGVGSPPPRLTTATSPNSQAAFANFSYQQREQLFD